MPNKTPKYLKWRVHGIKGEEGQSPNPIIPSPSLHLPEAKNHLHIERMTIAAWDPIFSMQSSRVKPTEFGFTGENII